MIISVLKKEAKSNLKGKWKKAILFMIAFFITNILLSFLKDLAAQYTQYGLFANILNIAILLPLNYGIVGSFIKLKRGEKVNFLYFLYYTGRDFEKVWKNIGRLLWKFLICLIGILLSAYLVVTEIISLSYGYGIRLSFFVEIIILLGFTILFSTQVIYYSLNNYILFDNREWKAKEILKESKRLMQSHRWDFVKMYLSFAGWSLLGVIFSVGIILALYFWANINHSALLYISYIPLIFLQPYMNITAICFYDNLLYNNPKPKEEPTNTKKTKKKFNNKKSKKKK